MLLSCIVCIPSLRHTCRSLAPVVSNVAPVKSKCLNLYRTFSIRRQSPPLQEP